MLPGKHGIHVHEKGDTSDHCAAALGHFNPYNKQHGSTDSTKERHAGDLGNIEADSNGVANSEIEIRKGTSSQESSLYGDNSIIGHTLVIHAKEDTFVQPTGGAGARLVCGIINKEEQCYQEEITPEENKYCGDHFDQKDICDGPQDTCIKIAKENCWSNQYCYGIMFGNDWSTVNNGVKMCNSWTLQGKPDEDKNEWSVYLKCNKGKW